MGFRMSLKIHFFDSCQDFFCREFGAMSDKQVEHFHQDIASMEQRYRAFWNERMLADDCCMLYRNEAENKHQRKSKSQRF